MIQKIPAVRHASQIQSRTELLAQDADARDAVFTSAMDSDGTADAERLAIKIELTLRYFRIGDQAYHHRLEA